MKYVSSLRVAVLACNIMLRTLPAKIALNFPDIVSMIYSQFFFKSGTGLRTSYNTITKFEKLQKYQYGSY